MGFILQVARATCLRILPENIVDLIKNDHDFLKQKKKETERNITFVNNANVYLPHINLFLFIEK